MEHIVHCFKVWLFCKKFTYFEVEHQYGIIYITCDIDSSHTYVGETKRPLSQRFKEHTNLDKPTGVGDHCQATGHSVSMKNTKVLTRESNWHKRKLKAMYINIKPYHDQSPGIPPAHRLCSKVSEFHTKE